MCLVLGSFLGYFQGPISSYINIGSGKWFGGWNAETNLSFYILDSPADLHI